MKEKPRPQYLDIGRKRRWGGLVFFLLTIATVSALLGWMLLSLTRSLSVAILVVAFMVGYMGLIGWWTMRNILGRQRDEM